MDNFFNRLYKKDKSRKSVGNGLGLAITKEIVNIHMGCIKAEIKNEGVVFILKIPIFNKSSISCFENLNHE